MTNYTTQVAVPQSFITKGKQRLKQYVDTVYMNDKNEFEVELYNPTQYKVLTKIKLNGNSIGSGVVLRPGERVFLERYLDEAKKFLFETYQVNGSSEEIKNAIANNGNVVVEFYTEQMHNNYYFDNNWQHTTLTIPNWNYPWYGNGTTLCGSSTGGLGCSTLTSSAVQNTNFINTAGAGSSYSNTSLGGATTDSLNYVGSTMDTSSNATGAADLNPLRSKLRKKSLSLETGRVEKGSSSNQTFTYDSSSFNSWYTWVNTWKILPVSQKQLVKEDLVVYCGGCGSRRKKDSHHYCPACGTKF